jgi:hypothetical protein
VVSQPNAWKAIRSAEKAVTPKPAHPQVAASGL